MIKLASYFTGFRSRADKSIGLTFETQELSGEALASLQGLNQTYGWLLYKENDADIEVPENDALVDETEKSPSEILRGRMFVYWKEKKIAEDFTTWKRKEYERWGKKYLDALL